MTLPDLLKRLDDAAKAATPSFAVLVKKNNEQDYEINCFGTGTEILDNYLKGVSSIVLSKAEHCLDPQTTLTLIEIIRTLREALELCLSNMNMQAQSSLYNTKAVTFADDIRQSLTRADELAKEINAR